MGNCFGSSDKHKHTRKLEVSPKTPDKIEMESVKLQDYFNIDNQDLKIDSFDLNTTTHPAFSQIAKDIERTYPKQQYFKSAANKAAFERLLKRIALHYPKLGYTQGINFVAGYFLLNEMSELEAYKSFVSMLVDPELMLIGLYEDQFPMARLYCNLFWKLLRIKCPKFAEKIEAISLPDEMWIFQWFICFFIYNYPIQYISQIFCFILKEKKFAMVRLALGIMMHLEKRFKNVNDQFEEEFVQCMESLKEHSYCKNEAPLNSIISHARTIKVDEITNLLSDQSENWYENYFRLDNSRKGEVYQAFINQKDKDRRDFFGKVKSGISIVTYERNPDSVEVMDNIEQKKARRYQNLYQSLGERHHGSFIKFAKRYSLKVDRYDLVESIIQG